MADGVPTSRELEALKVLWRLRRATVREIYRELKPRDGERTSHGRARGAAPSSAASMRRCSSKRAGGSA